MKRLKYSRNHFRILNNVSFVIRKQEAFQEHLNKFHLEIFLKQTQLGWKTHKNRLIFPGAIYRKARRKSHKEPFAADILQILRPIAYLTSSDDAEFQESIEEWRGNATRETRAYLYQKIGRKRKNSCFHCTVHPPFFLLRSQASEQLFTRHGSLKLHCLKV